MILKPAWMASSPVARLLVAGLVVAAAGMLVQYGSGVDYPTIPPLVVAVAAGIVAARPSIGARATTSPTGPTA